MLSSQLILRRTLSLLILILILVSSRTSAFGEFTPRTYEARKTDSPPVLDGNLDDPVWSTAQTISDFYAYRSGGAPPAAETSARILWDDNRLYLAFEMLDADIRPSSLVSGATGRDASLFQGDVIELFVRQDTASPQYHEFEWSPNGSDLFDARFDRVRFGSPGISWNTDLTGAVRVDGTIDNQADIDTGWTVEASIPLSAFEPIDVGSEWTFAVARYDFFNPGFASEQLMISTPGDPALPGAGFSSGFHTYELYNYLAFVQVPEPTSAWLAMLATAIIFLARRRT